MLMRLTINLSEAEQKALEKVAASELRDKRDQARLILREGLAQRGQLVEPIASQSPRMNKCALEKVQDGEAQ